MKTFNFGYNTYKQIEKWEMTKFAGFIHSIFQSHIIRKHYTFVIRHSLN